MWDRLPNTQLNWTELKRLTLFFLTPATSEEPEPVSGKIVFFSGLWMGLILLTCYSAILVSILTTRQPQLPFRDFVGLLQHPDWNLGVRTNTALADSLAVSVLSCYVKCLFIGNILASHVKADSYCYAGSMQMWLSWKTQLKNPIQEKVNLFHTLMRDFSPGKRRGSRYSSLVSSHQDLHCWAIMRVYVVSGKDSSASISA